MRMIMDIRLLHYFLVVAEEQNITRAAVALLTYVKETGTGEKKS